MNNNSIELTKQAYSALVMASTHKEKALQKTTHGSSYTEIHMTCCGHGTRKITHNLVSPPISKYYLFNIPL